MSASTARSALARAVRDSGLIPAGSRGIVLISGGADSAATATGLVEALSPDSVLALHLNYGLRPDSGEDEETCGRLCAELGIELAVERPALGEGNLQAEAREARYRAAERLLGARGLDWVATGHTRTDLAETVLYRLAASPGRRALQGLPAGRGNLVRPLLALDRDRVRELAEEAGLPFRDDPSNQEPLYARNRIRNEILPVLREIRPDAESAIAETQAELNEEAEALEGIASQALELAGAGSGNTVGVEALQDLDPAVRRIALRQLAERAAGAQVPLGRARAAEIWTLAQKPEGGVIELGGGVEAHVEHGHLRFTAGPPSVPAETTLTVPGACRFGSWEVRAELESGRTDPGPDRAVLDPSVLEDTLVVRAWRDGDRMRPLGLGGSKSLQDLFTDRKVPRSLRGTLPLVVSRGQIAWIAGVAVSEEFAAPPGSEPAAVLSASQVAPLGSGG